MALLGALNGSNAFLRVKTASYWLTIGGQTSHGQTSSNAAIDITYKQNGGYRDILDDAGLQLMDVTSELIFSTDEAFDYMKAAATSKTIQTYQVVRGVLGVDAIIDEFNAMVTSFAETSPDNDKVTASVTFMSSSEWAAGERYEQLLASDGPLFTENGSPIFVRIP